MVVYILSCLLSLSFSAHADKHGAVVTDLVKKGTTEAVYKAELLRSGDTLKIKITGSDSNAVALKTFDKSGSAVLKATVKGKEKKMTFPLTMKKDVFTGPLPQPPGKPYTIEVVVKENGQELMATFGDLN